tara:strand:- start:812 stop:1600 length:789 start_codon:yes stop_codon:yes gene_type:complete
MRYNKRIVCIDDPISNNLAMGVGAQILKKQNIDLKSLKKQIIFRGVMSCKFLKNMVSLNKNFYYIDTGYLGNYKKKVWHRIIKNGFHMNQILEKPRGRLDALNLERISWKKDGRSILICPISKKSSIYYDVDPDKWLKDTISIIRLHSDRPIVIREKSPIRRNRIRESSLFRALDNDIFCLVTYNSIAAVESIYYGIPAFTLGENAACAVSSSDLSKIEYPVYPDREMWLRNIAYSQFTCEEMRNGTAINILKNTPWGDHEV